VRGKACLCRFIPKFGVFEATPERRNLGPVGPTDLQELVRSAARSRAVPGFFGRSTRPAFDLAEGKEETKQWRREKE
jgi:hypothetical protein